MSAAGGSAAAFVFIKSTADADFCTMSVEQGEMVGLVLERACAKYSHWRLNALQVRAHLVAGPGAAEEPGLAAIDAALAKRHLPVRAPIASGAWLVVAPAAPPGGPGAVPGAGQPAADLASIAQSIAGLQLQITSLAQHVVTKDVQFSSASPSAVRNLLAARSVHEHGDLPLPSIEHLKPDPAGLAQFAWRAGMTEPAAAPHLLQLLERWVKSGSPPALDHSFVDVQGLAEHSPLVIFAVDWKTPSALARGVKQQALLHVLGLGQIAEGAEGPPVFFTDLKSHFLCYCLVGEAVYCYEGAGGTGSLSLAEGVGLIRHFLLRDLGAKARRLAAAVAATSAGEGADLTAAAAQEGGPPEALERAAVPGDSGSGSGGSGGGGGRERMGGSDKDCSLDCVENCGPFEGLCSLADEQALNVVELQSITLALTHQLTAHGGISRKVFFQQEE